MYYHHGKIYCYLWWKIAACYSKIWSSFRKCLPGWKILVISPCYGEIHKWFKTRFIVNIRVTIITKTIFKFFLSESELIFIFSLSIASGVLSPLKCKINKRHEQLFLWRYHEQHWCWRWLYWICDWNMCSFQQNEAQPSKVTLSLKNNCCWKLLWLNYCSYGSSV